jgi:hypothetical protein
MRPWAAARDYRAALLLHYPCDLIACEQKDGDVGVFSFGVVPSGINLNATHAREVSNERKAGRPQIGLIQNRRRH